MKNNNFFLLSLLAVSMVPSCISMQNSQAEKSADALGDEFFEAIAKRDIKKVEAMLKDCPDLVHVKRFGDETPLHAAMRRHVQPALVKLLLEQGADVNARDDLNMNPFLYALSGFNYDYLQLLIAHCANTNSCSEDGRSPSGCYNGWPRLEKGKERAKRALTLLFIFGCEFTLGFSGDSLDIAEVNSHFGMDCLAIQNAGGIRTLGALEAAEKDTKFPLEINKIILSLLAKPWEENIQEIADSLR